MQETVVVIQPEDDRLGAWPHVFGSTPGERLEALAAALTSSPPWVRLQGRATCVVRPHPLPLLAVVVRAAPEDEALVRALGWQVQDSLARLLPVPYVDVEAACERLASRLRDRLGADFLGRCTLLGLPRGGLIVAGLLAYCLGLPSSRVASHPPDHRQPLLVVDDCMLSGARTRRWLRANPGPPVVLAHLHSHPALREAVEMDPRVLACIAAVDLEDHAPRQQREEYPAWRQRWQERSPDDYWTGHPDHVCYPWNEPDTLVWNPVTKAAERGWHVVPPSWCLKNRQVVRGDTVRVCASSRGSSLVADDVIWAELPDKTVLINVDSGAVIGLEGTAIDFWRAMLEAVEFEEAVSSLAATYRVDATTVAADLHRFTQTMTEQGVWRH